MKKLVTVSKLTLLAALTASNLALAAGKRPAEDQGDQLSKRLRDAESTDQQVPASTTITLVSSDEESFNVLLDLAMLSGTIKNMLGDSTDTNQSFPLPNISSATLKNLIPCLKTIHAGNGKQPAIRNKLTILIKRLSNHALAGLINAANFLDIPQILKAIFTSQPLLERAVNLHKKFPSEINTIMLKKTIFSSKNTEELKENIRAVSSTNILSDPVWMRVIVDTLITSDKFGTAQDLFFLMAEIGLVHGLQALLNRADVNHVDQNGWTALMKASLSRHIEAAEMLLNTPNFDPNAHNQLNKALSMAASNGDASVIKLFWAKGANVNHVGQFGWTALMWAAFSGNVDATELFLNTPGFDPNAHNQLNKALNMAAKYRTTEIIKPLVAKGANVNYYADQHGGTALMIAASNGYAEFVEHLVKTPGFDPHAHNQINQALMIAKKIGYTKVVAVLENYLAALNAQALPVAAGQPEDQQQELPAAQEKSFWKKNCLVQ
jgi:ankyrin repeat protein